jgi:peptidyl-prolyl cis-trans isomerase SurA
MIHIKRNIFLTLLFLFIFAGISYSQKEGDRIIAIVGNDVMLESDLQYQVQLYMRQNQLSQVNPILIQQVFQQLLNEKILVAKAEQDSIEIKPEEIAKELDYRLKSLLEQFGTEERIEQVYGMSVGKIRLVLKDDLEKKMKADRVKRKKFPGGIKVTDKEVKEFYSQYKDSLPKAREEYEILNISIIRKVTDDEKMLAKEKAQLILDSILRGADFSEMAKRHSVDLQSAKEGGNLGYARRGMFVPAFEDMAYSLKPGEISPLVETEFGYHIIRLNEKNNDQINVSHILIDFPKLESNDLQTISFLKELRADIEANKLTFEEAAKKYSQDPETALKEGYLGFVTIDKLDSSLYVSLKAMQPKDITGPTKIGDNKNYSYELIKLKSINPEHKLTLETDYDKVKRFAEYFKETAEVEKWVEEIKKNIFVEIKL